MKTIKSKFVSDPPDDYRILPAGTAKSHTVKMNPKQTLAHIAELCRDAKNRPNALTFSQIAEWCEKQIKVLAPRLVQHTIKFHINDPGDWSVGIRPYRETIVVTPEEGVLTTETIDDLRQLFADGCEVRGSVVVHLTDESCTYCADMRRMAAMPEGDDQPADLSPNGVDGADYRHRKGTGKTPCRYCGEKDCDYSCDESQAAGFQRKGAR